MQIFVAVTTGQNVANLPPILQFAASGDLVIWLESELAAEQAWSAGAVKVLSARGITSCICAIEGDINDPLTVQKAAERMILQHGDGVSHLYMVLNGGQKLTPFGLGLAARGWRDEQKKTVSFLYGDDQPSILQVFHRRISACVELIAYTREKMLSFSEVLLVRDSEICDVKTTWHPGDDVEEERYGRDEEVTRLVHYREMLRFSGEETGKLNWPGYNDWAFKSKKRFKDKMESIFQDEKINLQLPDGEKKMDYFLSRIVAFMRDGKFKPALPRRQLSSVEKQVLEDEGWSVGGKMTGERFEKATFRRVTRFFTEHQKYATVIKEVVWGGKVDAAEFDVAIILLNGLVLHLECKSGPANKKDLQSRQLALEKSVGRLARMYVVVPFFPGFAGDAWFKMHYEIWRKHRDRGLSLLTYGPLKRGKRFLKPDSAAGDGEDAPEVFEDVLVGLLNPYVD